jgi:uncharacterized protein YbcC (UPF0753/DUF2309 family)
MCPFVAVAESLRAPDKRTVTPVEDKAMPSTVLHELKHYLPSQTPLKDFIHHNSLHAFQSMKFYEAIFKASKIFGFQATLPLIDFRKLYEIGRIDEGILDDVIAKNKGSQSTALWKERVIQKTYNEHTDQRIGKLRVNWKSIYQLDLDNLVQPLLFRVLSSYLDQGIAIWDFPINDEGFLSSIRTIEKNSFTSFFKTERAKQLLFQENSTISDLLKLVVGDERYYEQYLFDQQFSHRGWSGMVATLEDKPESLLSRKKISLNDFIIFDLLLEIDHLTNELGKDFQPLCTQLNQAPIDLFDDIENTELHDVLKIWQDAFEWSYYDEILAGIQQNISLNAEIQSSSEDGKSFQALFCIDEREC